MRAADVFSCQPRSRGAVRVQPATIGGTGNHRSHHIRIALAVVAVLVIVAIVLSQWLATVFTNYLWYHSVHLTNIYWRVLLTKLGLGVVFSAVAIAALIVNLYLVDKIARRSLMGGSEVEFVQRYQVVVNRHPALYRSALAIVVGLLLGIGASSEWRHFLLFTHSVPFKATDPQFGRNDSFFVFRLPFLSFLGDWALLALFVVFLLTALFHYLNGNIRSEGHGPAIEPRAIGQLSGLLGLMALDKAAMYFFIDRFSLETTGGTVVRGAEYTGIHVRLPALDLMAVVALVGFVLLVYNAYHRSLLLPLLAVGTWALIAFSAGVLFPAIVQSFDVTPAQSTLELPYIARNITATREAMGLNKVKVSSFPAAQDLTPAELTADADTLNAVRIWDPSLTAATYQKLQQIRSYYNLSSLAVDRYNIDGTLTPIVVGVREIDSNDLPEETWVNLHLQYTHGYGAVLSPANVASASGSPVFSVGNVPPTSAKGFPVLSEPEVYYGTGLSGFVVVDSKQAELDYQKSDGANVEVHYKGSGGERLSSVWVRLAYAIRFHDFNLLVSNLVTNHSRVMFVRSIQQRVEKAFPFLAVDSDAYPVEVDGHIDFIVDAYTTSDNYPYGQSAENGDINPGSGLSGTYNYVRNSVKVVVNSYSGKISAYVVDPSDPIIRSYESIFPGTFKPLSAMGPALRSQLRYPENLLEIQAAMYGRYHITNPAAFYNAGDAWALSETAGTGSPSSSLPTSFSGAVARFTPVYEVLQLPGSSTPSFDLLEPLVPVSGGDTLQTLSALFVASCGEANYGELQAYVTPRGESVDGPALVNARINAVPAISSAISLLDSHGSSAILGTVMMLPIDNSLVYVRPLYVTSSQNNFPELHDVIVVYGKDVAMEPTLAQALADVFHSVIAGVHSSGTSGLSDAAVPAAVRSLLSQANSLYISAEKALKGGDLATYANDIAAVGQLVNEANADLSAAAIGSKAPVVRHRATRTKKGRIAVARSRSSSSAPSSSETAASQEAPASSLSMSAVRGTDRRAVGRSSSKRRSTSKVSRPSAFADAAGSA